MSFLLFFTAYSAPRQSVVNTGPVREKLMMHANQLKAYAIQQKCSQSLGILIDMSIASRKKRFFVIDLETDSILVSGLCAQGQGNNVNREEVVFSNTPGSYCTSEGRYKMGEKFVGEFGPGFKLYGLDPTNSNALNRFIVFHYHPGVGDEEDAKVVCRSNGCPMVSPKVFARTEKLIDLQDKPVLMWIYK